MIPARCARVSEAVDAMQGMLRGARADEVAGRKP
jgi:hypothetical protein